MDEQPQGSARTSETVRSDPLRRHLLSLALAGLVVVSLGVGFLGGYLAGRGSPGDPAATPHTHAGTSPAGEAAAHGTPVAGGGDHQPGPGGTVTCAFDLPIKDQPLLAGMTCNCNEPPCNRTPLLACHCNTAHSMKALAKQLIVEGRATSKEIGAELEKRWGAGIVPAR